MSHAMRVDGKKGNSASRTETLWDRKRKGIKQDKKAAKVNSDFAKEMQKELTKALKLVKTQTQLTNLEEMVSSYGSKKNRDAFDQLQSTFRKEARILIDTELATITTKEQLESIRSMVELNGSQAQKAKFAEFESYFARPTWGKYASIHGTNYKAPTSGVGEADRIAEQIIHTNNMKQAEADAQKAKKAAEQTRKALAASARMDDFLAEGDKLIEQGKALSQTTSVTQGAGAVTGQVTTPIKVVKPSVIGEGTNVGGGEGVHILRPEQVRPAETAQAVEITEQTGKGAAEGEKAVQNASKLRKFFKKGVIGLLGLGAVALACYGLKKCQEGNADVSAVKPSTPKTPDVTSVQPKADKANPAPVPTTVVADSSEVAKDTTAVVKGDTTAVIKNDTTAVTAVIPQPYELSDKEVAEKIEKGTQLDDSKFYVVVKGDCVWKLIEKRLEKNKSEYNLIRDFLKELYGRTPSHDAIIRHATILTCEANGIKYIIDDKKLMPNDTLRVPNKFDVQNRFDTAA